MKKLLAFIILSFVVYVCNAQIDTIKFIRYNPEIIRLSAPTSAIGISICFTKKFDGKVYTISDVQRLFKKSMSQSQFDEFVKNWSFQKIPPVSEVVQVRMNFDGWHKQDLTFNEFRKLIYE